MGTNYMLAALTLTMLTMQYLVQTSSAQTLSVLLADLDPDSEQNIIA